MLAESLSAFAWLLLQHSSCQTLSIFCVTCTLMLLQQNLQNFQTPFVTFSAQVASPAYSYRASADVMGGPLQWTQDSAQ